MINYVFVPGLGTDYRVFGPLIQSMGLEKASYMVLEHVPPLDKSESMDSYVDRMCERLPKQEAQFVVIGLSLGGMLSVEIAKRVPVKDLIIISSIVHKTQRPFIFNLGSYLPLYHLFSPGFTRWAVPRYARLMGVLTAEEAVIMEDMMHQNADSTLNWGRRAAIHFRNEVWPERYLQIHGTKDFLIYKRGMKPHVWIKGGTHNIVADSALELSELIKERVLKLKLN
jgi:pimeloyl-ACP methyl ester carboxylesterase